MIRPTGITLVLLAVFVSTAPARPVQETGRRGTIRQIDLQAPAESPRFAPVFLSADQGTTYYGGTMWAADSARWEALEDSVWTFDSGVGSDLVGSSSNPDVDPFKQVGLHATMEGWTGVDNTFSDVTYFRRILATDSRWNGQVCVGSPAGLGGQASYWCGVFASEAADLCYLEGQGYGNGWNVCIAKTLDYTGGSVLLEWDMALDTEPGYDFLEVYVDSSSTGSVQVFMDSGSRTGHEAWTLEPGMELPSAPGPVTIRFCFVSDPSYSDEDGIWPTDCGGVALDNIQLGGGIVDGPATFESDEEGWVRQSPGPGVGGDWSNLVALSDLPAPLAPCPCNLADSVLVFEDLDVEGHGLRQDNIAASPWIDLGPEGFANAAPGRVIEMNLYANLSVINYVFLQVVAQWYPYPCLAGGEMTTSPWTGRGEFFSFGSVPICTSSEGAPFRTDFSDVISPGAEQIRIGIGVVSFCAFFANCTMMSNSSPWIDNVRLGVYGTPGAPMLGALAQDLPQDAFPTNGSLFGLAPGRIDCNFVRGASSPEVGSALGDTLVVQGSSAEAGMEVYVQFSFDPGPGVDSLSLANFYSTVTFVETRGGQDWYSARMDTAEIGGAVIRGRWMTTHIEGSPGFSGADTDPDPYDLDVYGRATRLANDIFPDHLFTMGTHLSLFYKTRTGVGPWSVLPDTTGGNYYTMEILPSSFREDRTWNCVLYVDHSDGTAGGRMAEGLRTVLGGGGGNHDGDRFDTYTVRAASSLEGSFGRPLNTEYGAGILQALAYRSILWNSGTIFSGNLLQEDANVLVPWLSLVDFGPSNLYLTGDNLVRSVFASGTSDPVARDLVEGLAGVTQVCVTYRHQSCPPGKPLDATACVGLDPATGAPLAGSLVRTMPHVGRGNGCPELRSFDVLEVTGSPEFGTPAGDEVYQTASTTSGPDRFASIVTVAEVNFVTDRYRVVTDGLSVEHRRDEATCSDTDPMVERLNEVLTLFGHTGADPELDCYDPIYGDVPEDPTGGFVTRLLAMSPNPLRSGEAGRIRFSMERPGAVRLDLFDVGGRLVKILYDAMAEEGWNEVTWTGENATGGEVASGVYFYRFRAFGEDQTQRLVFIRR